MVRRYKYKPKRRKTRKSYGKRKRYSKYPKITKFGSYGLPKAIFTKLTYSEHIALTSTSGSVGSYFFSLNNTYDPNTTGVGSQPYMRDTYAAMYNKYVVTGCKLKFLISTDNAYDMLLTTRNVVSTVSLSDIDLEVQRGAQRTLVSSARPVSRSNYYSIAKTYGVSKSRVLNDDVFGAAVSTGPARAAYLGLCYCTQDRTNTATMNVEVEMTFYVKFYEPADQAAS